MRKYYMRAQHKSIMDMACEWHGLGPNFDGKPIAGGIVEAEKQLKNSWRKHFNVGETKQFLRTKQFMERIRTKKMERDGWTEDVTVDWLDEIYQGDRVERKLSKLVVELKELGMVASKKPRGRKRGGTSAA
jgi:hypothetical protein